MVERQLPKLNVAGSNPVIRSKILLMLHLQIIRLSESITKSFSIIPHKKLLLSFMGQLRMMRMLRELFSSADIHKKSLAIIKLFPS